MRHSSRKLDGRTCKSICAAGRKHASVGTLGLASQGDMSTLGHRPPGHGLRLLPRTRRRMGGGGGIAPSLRAHTSSGAASRHGVTERAWRRVTVGGVGDASWLGYRSTGRGLGLLAHNRRRSGGGGGGAGIVSGSRARIAATATLVDGEGNRLRAATSRDGGGLGVGALLPPAGAAAILSMSQSASLARLPLAHLPTRSIYIACKDLTSSPVAGSFITLPRRLRNSCLTTSIEDSCSSGAGTRVIQIRG